MRPCILPLLTAIALIGMPLQPALAQAHVAESDAHTMRVSVVPSNQISSEMAREYGITVADNRGILNVVVLDRKQGDQSGQRSVPAEISATRIDLAGRSETIGMREMRANGGVSYLGSFRVVDSPRGRFHIEGLPEGAAQPLTVEFEDQFPLFPRSP